MWCNSGLGDTGNKVCRAWVLWNIPKGRRYARFCLLVLLWLEWGQEVWNLCSHLRPRREIKCGPAERQEARRCLGLHDFVEILAVLDSLSSDYFHGGRGKKLVLFKLLSFCIFCLTHVRLILTDKELSSLCCVSMLWDSSSKIHT